MRLRTQFDPRLLGARSFVVVSATRVAVACADARTVCMLDRDNALRIVGDCGDLGSEPGALVLLGSRLWTVLADGTVQALTLADVPALGVSRPIGANRSTWITATGSVVVAPGPLPGSVVVLRASDAVPLDQWDALAPEIQGAVAAAGFLYLFDGRGGGVTCTLNGTTGQLMPLSTWPAPDCQGVLRCFIAAGQLVVALDALSAVAVFDLTDPAAPVRSARTLYPRTRLRSALDNEDLSPLTDEDRYVGDIEYARPTQGGCKLTVERNALGHAHGAQVTEQTIDYVAAAEAAVLYYQGVIDDQRSHVWIHACGDDGRNEFPAVTGFASSGNPLLLDFFSTNNPDGFLYCARCQFDLTGLGGAAFCGFNWENGYLSGSGLLPTGGAQPGCFHVMTGATEIRLRVRGAVGGERVQFKAGGSAGAFGDTFVKDWGFFTLTAGWTTIHLPLAGLDLSRVNIALTVATTAPEIGQTRIVFFLSDVKFVYPAPRTGVSGFVQSWQMTEPFNKFDIVLQSAAYGYDQALLSIALIQAGDQARAQYICDAFAFVIANDRLYTDGRIRNAYSNGPDRLPFAASPKSRVPNWYGRLDGDGIAAGILNQSNEDDYTVSSWTGTAAWVGLALVAFHDAYGLALGDSRYLNAALALAGWVKTLERRNTGLGGYTGGEYGFDGNQHNVGWKSTEHVADLSALFDRLFILTGDAQWSAERDHARAFCAALYDTAAGHFWTGSQPDGVSIEKGNIPLDVQLWTIYGAKLDTLPYLKAVDYADANMRYGTGDDALAKFALPSEGGWIEGTAQLAEAFWYLGHKDKAEHALRACMGYQLADGRFLAVTNSRITTGFLLPIGQGTWFYFGRAHLGASMWFAIAAHRINPFYFPPEQGISPTVATPVIAPGTGTYSGAQSAAITCATAGAVIHFTIDGSTPTAASPVYSGPIAVAATETIKAMAHKGGFLDSAVGVAVLTIQSVAAAAINAISGWDGQVNSMAISGTTLIVGGTFTQATDASGVVNRNRLLGINLSTGLITSWNPNLNGIVRKVAIDPSGRIWAVGEFTTVGGVAHGRVARFSPSFVTDAFDANATGVVTDVIFDANNAYICGNFANAGGSARTKLAAFSLTTDALQPALIASITFSPASMCFLGADLYVVGTLIAVNGFARAQGFALVGGATLGTWVPTPNAGSEVNAIRTNGAALFVLGFFSSLHGTGRNAAGALLPDSSVQAWNPNLNSSPGGGPDALALSASAAYIAGLFSTVGGTGQSLFAKVDLTTGALQAWNPGQAGQGRCVLYDQASGMVFCGGIFNTGNAIFTLPA